MKTATVKKVNGHATKKNVAKKTNGKTIKGLPIEKLDEALNILRKKNIDLSYLAR